MVRLCICKKNLAQLSPTIATMATAWDAFPVSPTAAYANFCTSPPKRSTPTPTPSSYDRSSILSARLQLHPLPASTTTPTLPPEIIRRIIRAALSVPSSIPGAAQGVPTAAWDEFAGRAARRRISSQVAVRTQVTRTARSLMMVCRAWKVRREGRSHHSRLCSRICTQTRR